MARTRDRIKGKIPPIERVPIAKVLDCASYDTTLKAIESDIEGVGYIITDDEIVVLTKYNGYMRLTRRLAELIFSEALECLEVMP